MKLSPDAVKIVKIEFQLDSECDDCYGCVGMQGTMICVFREGLYSSDIDKG